MSELETLAKLASQLPKNLVSDWKNSNHFELHDTTHGGDYFWLDLSDMLTHGKNWCETDYGKRIGLVMDCIAALSRASDELNSSEKEIIISEITPVMKDGKLENFTLKEQGKDVVARWNTQTASNAAPSRKSALEQRLAELTKLATVVSDVFSPTNERESMAYHKLRQALAESDRIAQTEVVDERK